MRDFNCNYKPFIPLTLKPTTIHTEPPKPLKWYQKLWYSIIKWGGWYYIITFILTALEGLCIGVLLYWLKYM